MESEIRRICPKEKRLSSGLLSQAVTNLNSRVRNQGLTAGQIHFSRDTIAGENLHLNDNELMSDKLERRRENHQTSAKSKAPNHAKPHVPDNISPGQLVYIRDGMSKHEVRDPHIVTSVQDNKIKVQKILHSHSSSNKNPKITSEKIVVDEKYLYVPPHRRKPAPQYQGSSNDLWWRKSMTSTLEKTSPNKKVEWTPTHRQEDGDWLSEVVLTKRRAIDPSTKEDSPAEDDDGQDDDENDYC